MKRTLLGAALIGALALTGCAGPGGDGPGATEDQLDLDATINYQVVTVPSTLDPHLERSTGDRIYTFLIFDRLTQVDKAMTAQPMLATAWEFNEDATTLTMQLRDDVTFNDGTPFNAEAVVANIDRAQNLEGSTAAGAIAMVDGVEATAEFEVRFDFNAPTPEFAEILTGTVGTMISPAVIDSGQDLATDTTGAGSTAFVVDSFVPSESVHFVRSENENWDELSGRVAAINIDVVPDQRSRIAALRSGAADIAYILPDDPNGIAEAQAVAEADERYQYVAAPTGVLNAIWLNAELLPDLEVRQALVQATDAQAIAEDLSRGTCSYADQLVREGLPGHIPNFDNPLSHDVAAAEALLASVGQEGFRFDLGLISGRELVPQLVQEQHAEAGIVTELVPATAIEALTAYREDRAMSFYYQVNANPATSAIVSQDILAPNRIAGESPELAALAQQAATTVDPAERDEVYQEMMALALEQAFVVPICHLDSHHIATSDIVGLEDALIPTAQYSVDLRHIAVRQQ